MTRAPRVTGNGPTSWAWLAMVVEGVAVSGGLGVEGVGTVEMRLEVREVRWGSRDIVVVEGEEAG